MIYKLLCMLGLHKWQGTVWSGCTHIFVKRGCIHCGKKENFERKIIRKRIK